MFFVIAVSSTFPPVRMSTNSSGVCSVKHKKSAAVQLLGGQSRISTNSGLEMLLRASSLIWKVNSGRDASFTRLDDFSILSIHTDGRIGWNRSFFAPDKVYPLYSFSETEKLPIEQRNTFPVYLFPQRFGKLFILSGKERCPIKHNSRPFQTICF